MKNEQHRSPHPHLSPEQRAALQRGPGEVVMSVAEELIPAEQALLGVPEQVYKGLGNFRAYFEAPEGLVGGIYRQIRCCQRFEIMYPELTQFLEELTSEGTFHTTSDPSEPTHPLLIEAYELMRSLVDRQDQGVMTVEGSVDPLYLLR